MTIDKGKKFGKKYLGIKNDAKSIQQTKSIEANEPMIIYAVKSDDAQVSDSFQTSHRIPNFAEGERKFETSHHIPTYVESERTRLIEQSKIREKTLE